MSNSQNLLRTDPFEGRARVWLALGVAGVSILGVVTISLVVILVSSRKEEAAQMVRTAAHSQGGRHGGVADLPDRYY
jgi:hypothetical protein